MFPVGGIVEEQVAGTLLRPDSFRCELLVDYERGSLALNDPTGGLLQSYWRLTYANNEFILTRWEEAGPIGDPTVLPITPNGRVTSVSLAFDSNMRPYVTWVDAGVVRFYWYDTLQNLNVIDDFPGFYSPMLCLDDKRPLQSASRDVLFFYASSGYLYCRQQRDRFQEAQAIEVMELPINFQRLGRVGMGTGNRLIIELLVTAAQGQERWACP
jgi:hypothetical protein